MTVSEFNECVDLYADGLFRFILKNMKDEERARDVVQDTFEKVWQRVHEIQADKAKSYLFTTAYHTMIDNIRKNKHTTPLESDHDDIIHHDNQYNDLKSLLQLGLQKLSPVQRSVVLLRDYEGYSYEEIGEITGLSSAQVKVYIFRARLFLKEFIGSMDKVL
jgi:RNA polymerase sigma factor (sigma-70 family)